MRKVVLYEVLKMAMGSLRSHKMRSLLTVLGIVIGIMMVVGMTSLIRGFDKSITGQIESMGSDTLYLIKWSGNSLLSGADLRELLARPDIDERDAEAIERFGETVRGVSVMYGASFPPAMGTLVYRGNRTSQTQILGVAPAFLDAGDMELGLGRFVSPLDLRNRSDVVVIGNGARNALFPRQDPINRRIRINGREYRVVGAIKERAAASMVGDQADNFAIVPSSNYRKLFGPRSDAMILLRAKRGIPVEDMQAEVEGIMRGTLEESHAVLLPDAGRAVVCSSDGGRHRRHGDHARVRDRTHT